MKQSGLQKDWTVLQMFDYDKMREAVVGGLSKYVNLPVIRQNQDAEPPPYDYLSYTITTPMGANKGTYGEYEDGKDRKPFEQIWSISSLSDDDTRAVLNAVKAREWFDHVGTTFFSDNGIDVVSVGGVTNRDNLLTVGYEYKKGFDVVFSLFDTVENPVEESGYIETFEPNINETGGEGNSNT